MKLSAHKPRQFGAADLFVEERQAAGRVSFSLAGLIKETGLSTIAAIRQLQRLDRVTRVAPRQPFFLIIAPEHRAIGAPPINWWLHDYFKWLDQPYYLALQSAAGSYGSNLQALQVTQVMTKKPRRPLKIGRLRVQFFVKRTVEQTPTQLLENAFAPLQVSTPEATVFDLIRYAPRIGGIERAMETIGPLVPLLRATGLRRVLGIENEVAAAQRLGFVLEKLKEQNLAKVVKQWLPAAPALISLVPGLRRDAIEIKRWHILDNAREMSR
ncbi:MAG TPA: type IV toxin-antitoxin system AbiEi family antitoxin [Verrucomicrobiae bacterium]|jgi:hypothetical protein